MVKKTHEKTVCTKISNREEEMDNNQIAENIYQVGVIDWNIRDFHGYSTDYGSTYNAFLIIGKEKTVLIDTVKARFSKEFIDNISKIIDPKKIDILISNHTEMDHSGSIPRIMHLIGKDKPIYCSPAGERNLKAHFGNYNYKVVKSNDTLDIGGKTLSFLETKMLHWPDSMFTYIKEDQILFSSDAFGQHYASFKLFSDEEGHAAFTQGKKYFANILLLFSKQVLKLLEKIKEMDLKIKMICPDHGFLFRKEKDINKIVSLYEKWSRQESLNKALVVYDTMWHSTEKMAKEIAKGIAASGKINVKLLKLGEHHRSDIITELLDSKALILGCPTLNNGILPKVADFLTYMKGLKPKGKKGVAFGSYGWSGESIKIIEESLKEANFEIVSEPQKVLFVPDKQSIKALFETGKKIAEKL